ncbi:MAG: signal peptidase I [Clostridiales Family XIII bacterium]|jgi:signal peptidase I|nr:signal peptidase I [Clostridiales Family XIII bacterium]
MNGGDSDGARPQRPARALIEDELRRRERSKAFRTAMWSAAKALLIVAAVSVLISTLWVPVLRVYGESMLPTLRDGEIVISFKQSGLKRGDIIAFHYNNKALLKRVIALSGEWVDIDENGVVSVNGETLDEPYAPEKAPGNCDIELPYQVPDGRWFVMGDRRASSVDSRASAIGAVSDEQIIGKVAFRVWPLSAFGRVE